ncbi:MAG: tetratricopeptide repeat protein [Candidatus Acidiferrales bacterium]|jgi:Tfp pilus assembly protein PilF
MKRAIASLVLSLALAAPAWSAQGQQKKTPAPASGESSSSSSQIPVEDQAQTAQTDASRDAATAEKDIEVGSFYIRKGDPNAAIPRFQDAIRLRPNYAKPRVLLAEAYEKQGDKPSAVKTYKEYLQAFPKAPDAEKIHKKIEKLSR